MTFIDQYSALSKWFYVIVLGLAVPFYLLLQATSGHPYDAPREDIIWMTVVALAAVVALIFFMIKKRLGTTFNVMKIIFAMTLVTTAFGGVNVFVTMLLFDFEDGNFLVRVVSCAVPAAFVFSSVVIFIGLLKKNPD